MGINAYTKRDYREKMRSEDLVHFTVSVEESDLFIAAEKDLRDLARTIVERHRTIIKEYPDKDFFKSHIPLPVPENAAPIIRDMARVARISGTGPMASVAGAIAEYTAKELLLFTNELIIENGGDIFLRSAKNRTIKIFAGNSVLSEKIMIEIPAKHTPLGICTSSGTVGHSFSYGNADAVVVLSPDTLLADAVATAAANRIKEEKDIGPCIEYVRNIPGISGLLIIINDKLGVWGDVKLT
jgi:hypothetical protein